VASKITIKFLKGIFMTSKLLKTTLAVLALTWSQLSLAITPNEAVRIASSYVGHFQAPSGVSAANTRTSVALYPRAMPESIYRVYFSSEVASSSGDVCRFNVFVSQATGKIVSRASSQSPYLDMPATFTNWSCYFYGDYSGN
jgi:hypothetical protein